jgi:hypothetical protein
MPASPSPITRRRGTRRYDYPAGRGRYRRCPAGRQPDEAAGANRGDQGSQPSPWACSASGRLAPSGTTRGDLGPRLRQSPHSMINRTVWLTEQRLSTRPRMDTAASATNMANAWEPPRLATPTAAASVPPAIAIPPS